jgi:hypothetical protein
VSSVVWWLFDRTPKRFQDWVESWARTLIVRRAPGYKAAVAWARDTEPDNPEATR